MTITTERALHDRILVAPIIPERETLTKAAKRIKDYINETVTTPWQASEFKERVNQIANMLTASGFLPSILLEAIAIGLPVVEHGKHHYRIIHQAGRERIGPLAAVEIIPPSSAPNLFHGHPEGTIEASILVVGQTDLVTPNTTHQLKRYQPFFVENGILHTTINPGEIFSLALIMRGQIIPQGQK